MLDDFENRHLLFERRPVEFAGLIANHVDCVGPFACFVGLLVVATITVRFAIRT